MKDFFKVFSNWEGDEVVVGKVEELVHFEMEVIELLLEWSSLVLDVSPHDFLILLIEWPLNVFQTNDSFFGFLFVLVEYLHIVHVVNVGLCFLGQFGEIPFQFIH